MSQETATETQFITCQYDRESRFAYTNDEEKVEAEAKAAEADKFWMDTTRSIIKREPTKKEIENNRIDYEDDRSHMDKIHESNWKPTLVGKNGLNEWEQRAEGIERKDSKLNAFFSEPNQKERERLLYEHLGAQQRQRDEYVPQDLKGTAEYKELSLYLALESWNPDVKLKEINAIKQAMKQHEADGACPQTAKAMFASCKATRDARLQAFEQRQNAKMAAMKTEFAEARKRLKMGVEL